jgi:hypothetical protein
MAIALADRAAAGSLDGWDIAEYLATELSDSMPVGLATASARRPGMTRLHTENTTFPSLSDASWDRAPWRHSWSMTVH